MWQPSLTLMVAFANPCPPFFPSERDAPEQPAAPFGPVSSRSCRRLLPGCWPHGPGGPPSRHSQDACGGAAHHSLAAGPPPLLPLHLMPACAVEVAGSTPPHCSSSFSRVLWFLPPRTCKTWGVLWTCVPLNWARRRSSMPFATCVPSPSCSRRRRCAGLLVPPLL